MISERAFNALKKIAADDALEDWLPGYGTAGGFVGGSTLSGVLAGKRNAILNNAVMDHVDSRAQMRAKSEKLQLNAQRTYPEYSELLNHYIWAGDGIDRSPSQLARFNAKMYKKYRAQGMPAQRAIQQARYYTGDKAGLRNGAPVGFQGLLDDYSKNAKLSKFKPTKKFIGGKPGAVKNAVRLGALPALFGALGYGADVAARKLNPTGSRVLEEMNE